MSLDLSAIAAETLGRGSTGNRDIQAILVLHDRPGSSPSELADLADVSRSSLSRTLRRLNSQGLISRRRDDRDGRAAHLWLTPTAQERVAAFEGAIADYLRLSRTTFAEIIDVLRDEGVASSAGGLTPEPRSPLSVTSRLVQVGEIVLDDLKVVVSDCSLENLNDRAALVLIHDRGPVRPRKLAAALHLTSGGSTLLVDRLVANGLVHRQRPDDAPDRRSVLVACTQRGSEAASAICSAVRKHGSILVDTLEAAAAVAWTDPTDAAG